MLCKLVLHPLLCWAMLAAFGVSGLWLVISVIISATATALVVTVIAEVYSAVPEEAALTAVVANGLRIEKVRVPIGVVLIIFESRPNVTSDAAALCIKSGNAVILRGGKEAFHSNSVV